jgi:hypothetical protein
VCVFVCMRVFECMRVCVCADTDMCARQTDLLLQILPYLSLSYDIYVVPV